VCRGDTIRSGLGFVCKSFSFSPQVAGPCLEPGEPQLSSWDLPRASKLVSLYGVLDRNLWKSVPDGCPKLLGLVEAMVLRFCVSCYAPKSEHFFTERFTIGDLLGGTSDRDPNFEPSESLVARYPASLLICGRQDNLLASMVGVEALLRRAGHSVQTLILPGMHAYHGIPVQWTFGWWRVNALPSTSAMIRFLKDEPVQIPPPEPEARDYSMFTVFGCWFGALPGLLSCAVAASVGLHCYPINSISKYLPDLAALVSGRRFCKADHVLGGRFAVAAALLFCIMIFVGKWCSRPTRSIARVRCKLQRPPQFDPSLKYSHGAVSAGRQSAKSSKSRRLI